MKFKIYISTKIVLFFAVLILVSSIICFKTLSRIEESKEITSEISEVYRPTMALLKSFDETIRSSMELTYYWTKEDVSKSSSVGKKKLLDLHERRFPSIVKELMLQYKINKEDSLFVEMKTLLGGADPLIEKEQKILSRLDAPTAYTDSVMTLLQIDLLLDEARGDAMMLQRNISVLVNKMSIEISDQEEQIVTSFDVLSNTSIFSTLVLVVVCVLILLLIYTGVVKPIKAVRDLILRMSTGELPEVEVWSRNDEVGEMITALRQHVYELNNISEFAHQIGENDFRKKFKSLGEQDVLGNALMGMREKLEESKEQEEARIVENEKRNWSIKGESKFGEILRKDHESIESLTKELLFTLVQYTGSQHGCFFLVHSDQNVLKLASSFGFGIDKEKVLQLGEGLIGRCWKDAEAIRVDNIPNNYVTISSGLGESNPSDLLIVPVLLDEEVYGVIEIARLKVYEPYVLDFVEGIAKTIAVSINIQKSKLNTEQLLKNSQETAEQLKGQEEQMRSYLEEISEVQDVAERDFELKEKEYKEQISQLEQVIEELKRG